MHNSAQAIRLSFDLISKGQHAFIRGKVSRDTNRARFSQAVNGRIVRTVADDNWLFLVQKVPCDGEADTTTTSGDKNWQRVFFTHRNLHMSRTMGITLPHQHPGSRHSSNKQQADQRHLLAF